jgi:hypothetical protein
VAAMAPTISSRKNIDRTSPGPARPSRPTVGDVVASRPTARADLFAIAIVPNRGELVPACYDRALHIVRTSAREHGVDGWYTCDHTHYARIARHRTSSAQ